jgi:2-polyprenyl-3-methyl-5-hydroxy-6-metoxy-1,4-benzoquinol methylase
MGCSVVFKKYVQRDNGPQTVVAAQDGSYDEHKASMRWNEEFADKDEFLDKNFYIVRDKQNHFYRLNLTTFELAKKYLSGAICSIGCGGVGVEAALAEDGVDITATDLEINDFHDRVKELFESIKFDSLDILGSVEGTKKFDSVMIVSVTYLFDEEALARTLQNAKAILNSGGTLLITLDIAGPSVASNYILGDFLRFDTSLRNRYIQKKYKEKASLFYEQFFGYRHDDKCFIKKARELGFELVEYKKTAFGSDLLYRIFIVERIRKYSFGLAAAISKVIGILLNLSYRRYFILRLK